jgi:hypothetical protein
MGNTLIIYDTTGFIISQMSGDIRTPEGIPFLWVDVPEGKCISGVDVSVTPNIAVFKEYGAYDYENASLEDAKKHHIMMSKNNLKEYLANNPILSTCHNAEGGYYSLTEDKQNLLLGMISVTQMKEASGVTYQPSWNETGKKCTYDWTLEQLIQLSFEMEAVVRPLINQQQAMEVAINTAATNLEVVAVSVIF